METLLQLVKGAAKTLCIPVHPAGWPFVGIFAAVSLALFYFSCMLGWIGVVLTLWCVYFFRNPERHTPTRDGLIISPADGIVSMIARVPLPAELGGSDISYTRVSIFLNVFDVHVQRAPAEGEVINSVYHPGKFLNASLDKASEENERASVLMKLKSHPGHIAFVQIAGLIARRIICKAEKGQHLRAGERYGLIRFGSRVDVYLPAGVEPLVCLGQRMIGGETVMADALSSETARTGEKR